jgi:hypothetical protein
MLQEAETNEQKIDKWNQGILLVQSYVLSRFVSQYHNLIVAFQVRFHKCPYLWRFAA